MKNMKEHVIFLFISIADPDKRNLIKRLRFCPILFEITPLRKEAHGYSRFQYGFFLD